MLSREAVESYRRMTPDERFQLSEALTEAFLVQLAALPPDESARRWHLFRRDRELSRLAILRHLRQHDR